MGHAEVHGAAGSLEAQVGALVGQQGREDLHAQRVQGLVRVHAHREVQCVQDVNPDLVQFLVELPGEEGGSRVTVFRELVSEFEPALDLCWLCEKVWQLTCGWSVVS